MVEHWSPKPKMKGQYLLLLPIRLTKCITSVILNIQMENYLDVQRNAKTLHRQELPATLVLGRIYETVVRELLCTLQYVKYPFRRVQHFSESDRH